MSLKYLKETNEGLLKVWGALSEAPEDVWDKAEREANQGNWIDRMIGIADVFNMKAEKDVLAALKAFQDAHGSKPQGLDALIDGSIGPSMVWKLQSLKPSPAQWRKVVWGLPLSSLEDEDLQQFRLPPDDDESDPEVLEHGFDLTSFDSPEVFKKILKAVDINLKPTLKDRAWEWKGKGISLYTGNDPISGKYGGGNRQDEPGYASYIGITGVPEKVAKLVSLIKKFGDSKDESPGSRDFI